MSVSTRQHLFDLSLIVIALVIVLCAPLMHAQSMTQTFQITVNAQPCAIVTTPAPPNGVADGKTPYGPYTFTATASCGVVTWGLTTGSGPLPSGLVLSSTGVLSGTIATTACAIGSCNFPVTIQASGPNAKLQLRMEMSLPQAQLLPRLTVRSDN